MWKDAIRRTRGVGIRLTRVPTVRPRKVKWDLPVSSLARASILLRSVEQLVVGYNAYSVENWRNLVWPPRLKTLVLGDWFNRLVEMMLWTETLETLTFGQSFNRPFGKVMWPASLRKLTFGKTFDQPINDFTWTPSLEQLVFGKTVQPAGRRGRVTSVTSAARVWSQVQQSFGADLVASVTAAADLRGRFPPAD